MGSPAAGNATATRRPRPPAADSRIDFGVVRCRNGTDDRRAEAGARRHRVGPSVEGLEYPLALGDRNARPGIRHGQRAGPAFRSPARSRPSRCRRPANSEARCRRGSTAFRAAAARRRERRSARRAAGPSKPSSCWRASARDRYSARVSRTTCDESTSTGGAVSGVPARASDSRRLASSVGVIGALGELQERRAHCGRVALDQRALGLRPDAGERRAELVRGVGDEAPLRGHARGEALIRPLIERISGRRSCGAAAGSSGERSLRAARVDQRPQLLHRPVLVEAAQVVDELLLADHARRGARGSRARARTGRARRRPRWPSAPRIEGESRRARARCDCGPGCGGSARAREPRARRARRASPSNRRRLRTQAPCYGVQAASGNATACSTSFVAVSWMNATSVGALPASAGRANVALASSAPARPFASARTTWSWVSRTPRFSPAFTSETRPLSA